MSALKDFPNLATRLLAAAAVALVFTSTSALGALLYVNVKNNNATPPYTSWISAATNIQDAVDAAVAGDEIVVGDGVYASGGRAAIGTQLTNRLTVQKPVAVRSVNGPLLTIIQGYQVPGQVSGDASIRCVYLGNGASLTGFTLTNGAARSIYNGANDRESTGGGVYCEWTNAVVSNCVVVGSSASSYGGGVSGGTLIACTLAKNLSGYGAGGAYNSFLNNCTVTKNPSGGAVSCVLKGCTISSNSYGGAYDCTLDGCILTDNSDVGATQCRLSNCAINGSSTGVSRSTLYNCTLVANSIGASSCTLSNCLVYFNTSGVNYDSACTLAYCCTAPEPASGIGNVSSDPQLASAWHLSATSPCRGAGSPDTVNETDIDGEPWANPPAIGCDECHPEELAGPLKSNIGTSFTS